MNDNLKKFGSVIVLTAMGFLTGCGMNESSVRNELKDQVKDVKSNIQKLPPVIYYKPHNYSNQEMVDPFSPTKLSVKIPSKNSNGPDLERDKEPLEYYQLENIKLVGFVDQKGVKNAVVSADGKVYRVKRGNFMGTNFGKVKDIKNNEIIFTEMHQQQNGEWIEREASIGLNENTEVKSK